MIVTLWGNSFRPGPMKGLRGHDARVGDCEVKIAGKSMNNLYSLNAGEAQLVRIGGILSLDWFQARSK
jgi:hypothetical protein